MPENVRLMPRDKLDIVKTFECGQCFRWNRGEDGVYTGVAGNSPARVWESGGEVFVRSEAGKEFWEDYFDGARDYDAAAARFEGWKYLDDSVNFGKGIRILRQEPWEALCSFIISQCNNITRIKGIVERLCAMYGEPAELDGQSFYGFPTAERLSGLAVRELAELRAGYRAQYIISAARAVAEGKIDLEALRGISCDRAKAALLTLPGVGEKVANCAVLFGLGHMEAFPIDVWIRRALKEHFPADFDPAALGDCAGLAQQYIFYFARSGGNS